MSQIDNIKVGQNYGRLSVKSWELRSGRDSVRSRNRWVVNCICSCGTLVSVRVENLLSRPTISCGCYANEYTTMRNTKHGLSRLHKPEYAAWKNMHARCVHDKDYFGRGIVVCSEWDCFATFFADMGPRPSPKHSVDRKENSGPYCKTNCRWATASEQANNTRRNRRMTLNGQTLTVTQWCRQHNVREGLVRDRLSLGWDFDKALLTPLMRQKKNV